MRTALTILWRFVKALPLVLLFPILLAIAMVALALVDFASLFRARKLAPEQRPNNKSASVVIPNWNGRDLLEKYIPSIIEALADHPGNEILVVDNGSEDGSAEFLRERFPSVRVLALDRNLGFGGGSNAGFRAAANDIVVLLNSDMRVERDFLAPLLEAFTDETIFSVACQIFFSDPNKLREETGLTPARAIERLRVEAAREKVESAPAPIEAIARSVGFADPERMRRAFVRAFGQPPQALRRVARAL